jgi:hypothetical protein
MKVQIIFLVFCAITVNAVIEKARFDNYRVYELNIENDDQLNLMKEIDNNPDGVSSE